MCLGVDPDMDLRRFACMECGLMVASDGGGTCCADDEPATCSDAVDAFADVVDLVAVFSDRHAVHTGMPFAGQETCDRQPPSMDCDCCVVVGGHD